jgi:hypothetical protein
VPRLEKQQRLRSVVSLNFNFPSNPKHKLHSKRYFDFGVGLAVWVLPGGFAFEFIEVVPDELLVAGGDEVAGAEAAGEGC